MKKIVTYIMGCLWMIAAVWGLWPSVAFGGETQPESVTLMIYMIGSDLESGHGAAAGDLAEMEAALVKAGIGAGSENHVVIYTGGATQWHTEIEILPENNTVLSYEKDGFCVVDTMEAMSMGDPKNLTRFLNYATDQYKTDQYALILWDHGNGPVMGYGLDQLYDHDTMTLMELKEALAASPFGSKTSGKSVGKLAFIGFDACLMSSVELACVVSDYADYLIASQEVEPSFGWCYDFLTQLGSADTKTLINSIVEDYYAYCTKYYKEKEIDDAAITLAAMDLTQAGELQKAINTLFKKASKDVSGDYNALAIQRIKAKGFGRATTGSEYDLVDLMNLVEMMEKSYGKECKAVEGLIEEMVVLNKSSIEATSGLSIYYPYYNKNHYKKQWKQIYQDLNLFPEYATYLSRYDQIWLGSDMQALFDEKLVPVKDKDQTFSLQLTKAQQEVFSTAGFYILRRTGDELYQPVYYCPEVKEKKGKLKAEFDGNVIYMMLAGEPWLPYMEVVESTEDRVTYRAPFYVGQKEMDLNPVEMLFTQDKAAHTLEINALTYLEDAEEDNPSRAGGDMMTGKKQEVDIRDWQRAFFPDISARYLSRDEDGRIRPFREWTQGDWFTGAQFSWQDEFELAEAPLYDDGKDYYLMFVINDTQNNQYCSELIPMRLEEAPEDAKPVQEVKLTDDAQDEVVILEQEGVTISYCVCLDEAEQQMHLLHVSNTTDEAMTLRLTDGRVNQTYIHPGRKNYQIEPQIDTYYTLEWVAEYQQVLDLGQVESVDMTLNLKRDSDYKTLVIETPYRVIIDPLKTLGSRWVPMYSVCAKENQVIFDQDGVKITVKRGGYRVGEQSWGPCRSYSKGFKLLLEIENQSNTDHCVEIVDTKANGETTYGMFSYDVAKKSTITEVINADVFWPDELVTLESLAYAFSLDGDKEIWCDVPLEAMAQNRYQLVDVKKMAVSDQKPSKKPPELNLAPCMGALAKSQVLCDQEGMTVTLLGLGSPSDGSSEHLEGYLLFTNTSDHALPAGLSGIRVNDYFVVPGMDYFSNEKLPAGKRLLLPIIGHQQEIAEGEVTEISEVALLIYTKQEELTGSERFEGGTWYPVTLSEQGKTAAEWTPRGEIVYDQEGIKIYYEKQETEAWYSDDTKGTYKWHLWIVNDSDVDIDVRTAEMKQQGISQDEGTLPSEVIGYASCGAHARKKLELTLSYKDNAPCPELDFKFQIRTLGGGSLIHASEKPCILKVR